MYEEQKRFTDIAIQINLAFWTSLTAINGIIIASFAVIATSYSFDLLLSIIVIAPSVISCFLIIDNFLLAKKQYEIIINILDHEQEITENQKEKNKDDAKNKHKRIENNNSVVILFMVLQILFFVFFIIFPFSSSDFFSMKNSVPEGRFWQPPYSELHKPY